MNTELMQTADLLPFVNHNIASIHSELELAADKLLGHPVYGVSRAERAKKRPATVARLWLGRTLDGFYAAHYAPGSVFDLHGVPAMVDSISWDTCGFPNRRVVHAYVPIDGSLTRVELKESLAMALVWRKFSLADAYEGA